MSNELPTIVPFNNSIRGTGSDSCSDSPSSLKMDTSPEETEQNPDYVDARADGVGINVVGWWALRHRTEGWWVGNELGIFSYERYMTARVAMTILWQMDGGNDLTFRIERYDGSATKHAGTFETAKDAAQALADYEEQERADPDQFWIVNDMDRPTPHLITEKRADGLLHYIDPGLLNHPPMGASEATRLIDFGIDLYLHDDTLSGFVVRESKATYGDGKQRKWQGPTHFTIPIIR